MTTHLPCSSHALNEILYSIVAFGKYLYFCKCVKNNNENHFKIEL